MANSSDWLSALLERPQQESAAPKPLSWLPDFGDLDSDSFVEKLPFDRVAGAPDGVPVDDATEPLQDAETGDALEDILRQALTEGEEKRFGTEPTLEPAPSAEPEGDPKQDPIAEAFARGEEAGRQAAMAEQEALREQKLSLRQTFRALDQAAMDVLTSDLAETVIALCSQSLADYIPAPDALRSRCLEAAKRLGSGAGETTLYLHPDDLLILDKEGLGDWTIVGDPTAERGGMRLETSDGSVSDRPADWRRAIAAAIRR
jgi:flagellar assembly protein FliH